MVFYDSFTEERPFYDGAWLQFQSDFSLDGMARAFPAASRDTDKPVSFGESMFHKGVLAKRDLAVGARQGQSLLAIDIRVRDE